MSNLKYILTPKQFSSIFLIYIVSQIGMHIDAHCKVSRVTDISFRGVCIDVAPE